MHTLTVESVKPRRTWGVTRRRRTFDHSTYGADVETRAIAEALDDRRCGATCSTIVDQDGGLYAVLRSTDDGGALWSFR